MPLFDAPDGQTIAYDDILPRENGGPHDGRPMLLVHGFASNRHEAWKRTGWYPAIERRGQRLVAADLRGHGESGKPHDPAQYGREQMVGDVLGLMDHLGLEAVDLFGYSAGARVALGVALAAPDRVANLILGGVGGRSLEPSTGMGGVMAAAMETDDPETIAVPLLRSFRHFADEQGEDRLALAAFVRSPGGPLDPDELCSLSMPVLVAAGAQDGLAGDPQGLADAIRGAKAVTLAACDHFNAIPHALLKAAVFDFMDGYLDDPFA